MKALVSRPPRGRNRAARPSFVPVLVSLLTTSLHRLGRGLVFLLAVAVWAYALGWAALLVLIEFDVGPGVGTAVRIGVGSAGVLVLAWLTGRQLERDAAALADEDPQT